METIGLALVLALHANVAVLPLHTVAGDAGNRPRAERTYLGQVQAVNDCPTGLTRVSLEPRLDPHAPAPGRRLRPEPRLLAVCADLSAISAHALRRGYVRIHAIHRSYVGVPRSGWHPGEGHP